MSQLSKLKLVSVQARGRSAAVVRRNKLTALLEVQIASAKAATEGGVYLRKSQKVVADADTGQRTMIEIAKRVKQWWFATPDGKIALTVRYGAKVIEIAKGKNAVQVADMAELVETLQVIRDATLAGELDAQIEQASVALRAGFVKKK